MKNEKLPYKTPEMDVVELEKSVILTSGDQGEMYAPCPRGDTDIPC